MAQTLASVNVRIGARIEELEKGLRKAERALERSTRQMIRTGQNLTLSLTLPIAAAGQASLAFASDFESSFLKINTLVGVSGDTLEQFRDGIANLSGPLGQSQAKLSDALFVITSAGQRGSEALETLEAASKASSIGLGETADIARAAVAATQAYGSEVLSTTAAVDKLTAIVRAGNLEASELAPALGRVLPIASQLGVSFDEVGANIATFTRLGVSASESVTALKSLLSNLLKPSAEAAKEMERLGISAQELRDGVAKNGLAATLQSLIKAYDGNTEGLAKLFGNVEGLANALGTAGSQGEEYLKIVDEIAKSNGIVNDGFEKVSETAGFKMKRALVELQNVGVQLGGTLIPVVTELLKAVTPLISGFSKLSPTLQKAIVSSGLLVAALGPAVTVFGNLRLAVGSVQAAYRSFGVALLAAQGQMQVNAAATAANATAFGGLKNALSVASAAWGKLNNVAKASIVGATVAAVAALVVVVDKLRNSLSAAGQAQKAMNEVSKAAEENILAEKVAAQELIGVINDENATRREKEIALSRLNDISPAYFKGLKIEKDGIDKINVAYDRYIDNLLKAAKAQAAQEKIIELEKERLALVNELSDPSLSRIAANAFTLGGPVASVLSDIKAVDSQIEALLNLRRNSIKEQNTLFKTLLGTGSGAIDELLEQSKKLNNNQIGSGTGGEATPTRTAAPSFLLPPTESIADSAKKIRDALGASLDAEFAANPLQVNTDLNFSGDALTELGKQFEIIDNKTAALGSTFDGTEAKLAAVNQAMISLLDSGANPYGRQIEALKELQSKFNAELANNKINLEAFRESLNSIIESGIENTLTDISSAVGEAFAGLAGGENVMGVLLKSIAGIMEQLGKLAIGTGVAVEGIKKALQSLNPIAAIAGGAALIALAQVVKAKASALSVPKFATGGIVRQPTLALVGDNPNAASNPEYILRQDQLRTIAADISPVGGGGDYLPAFRLDGDTLLVWYERAKIKQGRRI